MGLFPRWVSELDFKDFFSSVGRDAVNMIKGAGEGVGGMVENIVKGVTDPVGDLFKKIWFPLLIGILIYIILFTPIGRQFIGAKR